MIETRAACLAAATIASLAGLNLVHPAHAHAAQQARAATAVREAVAQVGDPYRRGAAGPGSFDCSGLVQYAWRKAGVLIPRTTHQQWAQLRTRVSWRSLRPGDLLYFYGVGHAGIYIGRGRMVHAPGTGRRVQVVTITPSWWASKFNGARRPGA